MSKYYCLDSLLSLAEAVIFEIGEITGAKEVPIIHLCNPSLSHLTALIQIFSSLKRFHHVFEAKLETLN